MHCQLCNCEIAANPCHWGLFEAQYGATGVLLLCAVCHGFVMKRKEATELKLSQIVVETQEFEREHGRLPKGYGGWIFELCGDGSPREFMASATYTNARRAALAEAQRLGCDLIIVLP